MKNEPDYEVVAQLVTFRGETRSEALKKLIAWMDENEIAPWEQSGDVVIETGTGLRDEDNYFTASALANFKHRDFNSVFPPK